MSSYTIGEIVVWLLLTAVLSFALGWMCREFLHRSRSRATPDAAPVIPAPVVEPAPAPKVAPKKAPKKASKKAPEKIKPPDRPELPEPVETPIDTPVETAVDASVDAPAIKPGPHPGSALPLPGGEAPSGDHVVKVSRGSKIYHEPSSPAYARTTAAIWFTSAEAAENAGFRKPKNG